MSLPIRCLRGDNYPGRPASIILAGPERVALQVASSDERGKASFRSPVFEGQRRRVSFRLMARTRRWPLRFVTFRSASRFCEFG